MIIGRYDAARTELSKPSSCGRNGQRSGAISERFTRRMTIIHRRRESLRTLRLDPSYMEAYEALGFVMESLGDDNAALANYKKSAEMNETRQAEFCFAVYQPCRLLQPHGDPKLALENARKAVQVNPKSDGGNFQLGKALDRLQQWPEAA